MRVFLDTNVFVAATAARGLCVDVLRDILGHHDLVASEELIVEIDRVLRGKLGVPEGVIAYAIALIRECARCSEPSGECDVPVDDPGDRALVSAALAAGADLFVTGDKELLLIGKLGPMEMVSPRSFWERMRGPADR